MPFHRKIRRRTLGKEPRKMSSTFLVNLLATPVQDEIIIPTTNVGTSGVGDVLETADTRRTVSPNSIIKFLNLKFQCAIRAGVGEVNSGWFEYAIFILDQQEATPTINGGFASAFGTQTIGNTATNLFRNQCIWTGCAPVSPELPIVVDLKLKIPPQFCKMRRGQWFLFVIAFRSHDSTDTTTSLRVVYSHNYKCYL